ncbi:unnamed protein product [Blepharisma stoltei]|uniref:LNR domain-containing protein n=1 Tax=Blepharisma stoltei TaxID=1481888 RepID=A0AAU9JQB5_9CILI|nr:unnamed protein product [Blepharisma stoltei]
MLIFLLRFLFSQSSNVNDTFPYSCFGDGSFCSYYYLGDGICDPLCMSAPCNYDSYDMSTLTYKERFSKSDCFGFCVENGCNTTELSNGICENNNCNTAECGWELGDCGFCNQNCYENMLGNGVCDEECNTSACMYDNNDCGWCAESCFKEDLYGNLTECKKECDNKECLYGNYKCTDKFCAPDCPPDYLNDTVCDKACNNEECNWDNGDCLCAPNCTETVLNEADCKKNDPCDNKNCDFKNKICGECASGCFNSMLGDGTCDEKCNNFDCEYDYGDCGCAPGCSSYYNFTMQDWVWDKSDPCKESCLVPSCLYNYGVCNDDFYIQRSIIYQVITNNQSAYFQNSICVEKNEKCTEDIMRKENKDKKCGQNQECGIKECGFCMGYLTDKDTCSNGCLRCGDDINQCIQCNGLQVFANCIANISCPPGFMKYENFTAWDMCLPVPKNNSQRLFENIWVRAPNQNETDKIGIGTEKDPYNSLSYAFMHVSQKYTKINLFNGSHPYLRPSYQNPLAQSPYDPLMRSIDLNWEQIIIQSVDKSNPAIISFEDPRMMIHSNAKKLVISDIYLSGIESLKPNCTFSNCTYCPYLFTPDGKWYRDDQYYIVKNITDFPQNCTDNYDLIIIQVDSGSSLEISSSFIMYFQEQYKAFIMSMGAVNLTNVTFYRMQASPLPQSAIIVMNCLTNCKGVSFNFNTGGVYYINWGYEYRDDLEQSGFFYSNGIDSVIIYNVTFEYNMAISGNSANNFNKFIEIINSIGVVTIDNCWFGINLVNYLIYIDSQSLAYTDYDLDRTYTARVYDQIAFSLTNTQILSIYSYLTLITHLMGHVTQNINIDTVNFSNITAGGSGLLYIDSQNKLTKSEYDGDISYVTSGGVRVSVIINKRSINVTNVNINYVYSGYYLMHIGQMPNVKISNLNVENSGDGYKLAPNDQVIVQIINDPYSYIIYPLFYYQIADASCTYGIHITQPYRISITDTYIRNSTCKANSGGIYISDGDGDSYLNRTTVYDMSNNISSGAAIEMKNIAGTMEIYSLYFSEIAYPSGGGLRVSDSNNFTINNIYALNVLTGFEGTLNFNRIIYLNITDFTCENCESFCGNGGALGYSPKFSNLAYPALQLTKSSFTNCTALRGVGGSIYIESVSWNVAIDIFISDISIDSCRSSNGAGIYISNRISFHNATIKNINITSSWSENGAVLFDGHYNGFLLIDNYQAKQNEGLYCGFQGLYSSDGFILGIFNTSFDNCTCDGMTMYISSWTWGTTIWIENTNFTQTSPVSLYVSKSFVIGNNLYFYKNYNSLKVTDYGQATITNAKFLNNEGTSAYITFASTLACTNCQFLSNSIDSTIVVDQQSSITIQNSLIVGNNVLSPGSVANIQGSQQVSTIYNTTIMNNYSQLGANIEVINSILNIIYCYFSENLSGSVTPGINANAARIYINTTLLENQYGTMGSFLYLSTVSEATIENSVMRNGTSEQGGAILILLSSLNITNSLFSDNLSQQGGVINGITGANIVINGSEFKNSFAFSSGGIIYSNSGTLDISNSLFDTFNATGIYAIGLSSINISNTLFKYGLGIYGGVLYSTSTLSCNMNTVVFENNTASIAGAAIFFERQDGIQGIVPYNLTNTYFLNNSAYYGGAIYSESVSINFNKSIFQENYANSSGGAVYLRSTLGGTYQFQEGNMFYSNLAGVEGGAIKWDGTRPVIDSSNIWYNNSAEYGNDIASYPVTMQMATPFSGRYLADKYIDGIPIVGTIINVAPGQVFPQSLKIELRDQYGNLVTTDNTSSGNLKAYNSTTAISGTTETIAQHGIFNFSNFIISETPGSIAMIEISTSSIDPEKQISSNDFTNYYSTVILQIMLRNCTSGEFDTGSTCQKCEKGKYSLNPSTECKACPDGAICPGGSVLLMKPGYWRSSGKSDTIYNCPNNNACAGSADNNDLTGSCETGYYGHMCQACDKGYSGTSNNICIKCPGEAGNIIVLILIGTVLLLACAVIVKSTLESAYQPQNVYSVYLKIFTNYVQLVFLTTQFNLQWPDYVTELFNIQSNTATISSQIFSPECFLRQYGASLENSYYQRIIMLAILPIILWTGAFFIWLGIAYKTKRWNVLKRELIASMVVLLFMVHPNIIVAMFGMFSCEYIDGLGFWLQQNLEIKCWEGKHLYYSLLVGLPSIIVWGLTMPAIVLLIMFKSRKKLSKRKNMLKFGFLFIGYRRNRYYWEFLILYRKITIICLAVFIFSKQIQALTVLFILLISFAAQSNQRPYTLSHLNNMETQAVLIATFTIYCGLYYLTDDIEEVSRVLLFVFIIIGNLYFILYWLYYMTKAAIDIIVKSVPYLRIKYRKDELPQNILPNEALIRGAYIDPNDGKLKYSLIQLPSERIEYPVERYPDMNSLYLADLERRSDQANQQES